MFFRVDSCESQWNSYRKSVTNNNNNNYLHTNYLITDIEIDLIVNDVVKEKNDHLSMKVADNAIDTFQRSNTRFINQNNFEIRNIDDDDKEKDCQVGDTSKHSDGILTDERIDCQFKDRKDSINATRVSNFFSIFSNFM